MSRPFLPYGHQCIEDDDIQAVVEVLKGDWLTTGPQVQAFEKALAAACGADYAVVCANGTAALHLACLALGLSPGQTLLTTPMTFLATANCARFVGAEVAFADVRPSDVTLDPAQVAEALQARRQAPIRAVLPVHFAGHPADMAAIAQLAQQAGAAVIEDGCHALGASYRTAQGETVRVGQCRHSAMTCFSFHPVKHIATGEGGAVTTNDPELYQRLTMLRNHGMRKEPEAMQSPELAFGPDGQPNPWYYEMQELGYNYRLSDLQCALGLSQLAKLDRFLARRRELAAQYRERLGRRLAGLVQPPAESAQVSHAYHLFAARIDFTRAGLHRAELMRRLREQGIGSQVHYSPLHLHPYYRKLCGTGPGDFPAAEDYYAQTLSLPLYPTMPPDGVERVVTALEAALLP